MRREPSRGILGPSPSERLCRLQEARGSKQTWRAAVPDRLLGAPKRRFYELHVAGSSRVATETVDRMRALWAIEGVIRGRDPSARLAARRDQSLPVVQALWCLWETELRRISGKSKLAEAIRYAMSHRDQLERFLHDERAGIDNNTVERAVRPQTITRKNALFAGSDAGGRTWAAIATLLATARLNDIDPKPG